MQNGTDIYPIFSVTAMWFLLTVLTISLFIMVYFFGAKILKRVALHKQKKSIRIDSAGREKIINDAINKIQKIKAKYDANEISSKDAAYEASKLTRQVFDHLMNHKTSNQARYETKLRNLNSISELLDSAYPPEFTNRGNHDIDTKLFDKAIGVLELCR